MRQPPKPTYELTPSGNHVARLYQIIHLGTTIFEWQGKTIESDKLRFTFELCNKKKVFKEGEPEKPIAISKEMSYSMSPKSKLRPFVEGIIGTGLNDKEAYAFDPETLLGSECLINVVHVTKGDKTFAEIASATPLPEGLVAPAQVNTSSIIDVDTATQAQIDSLPEFISKKIKESHEYKRRFGGYTAPTVNTEDIPF